MSMWSFRFELFSLDGQFLSASHIYFQVGLLLWDDEIGVSKPR